jgi:hypothetical protein
LRSTKLQALPKICQILKVHVGNLHYHLLMSAQRRGDMWIPRTLTRCALRLTPAGLKPGVFWVSRQMIIPSTSSLDASARALWADLMEASLLPRIEEAGYPCALRKEPISGSKSRLAHPKWAVALCRAVRGRRVRYRRYPHSIRKHPGGLQSLPSMRRIEARHSGPGVCGRGLRIMPAESGHP